MALLSNLYGCIVKPKRKFRFKFDISILYYKTKPMDAFSPDDDMSLLMYHPFWLDSWRIKREMIYMLLSIALYASISP